MSTDPGFLTFLLPSLRFWPSQLYYLAKRSQKIFFPARCLVSTLNHYWVVSVLCMLFSYFRRSFFGCLEGLPHAALDKKRALLTKTALTSDLGNLY